MCTRLIQRWTVASGRVDKLCFHCVWSCPVQCAQSTEHNAVSMHVICDMFLFLLVILFSVVMLLLVFPHFLWLIVTLFSVVMILCFPTFEVDSTMRWDNEHGWIIPACEEVNLLAGGWRQVTSLWLFLWDVHPEPACGMCAMSQPVVCAPWIS